MSGNYPTRFFMLYTKSFDKNKCVQTLNEIAIGTFNNAVVSGNKLTQFNLYIINELTVKVINLC